MGIDLGSTLTAIAVALAMLGIWYAVSKNRISVTALSITLLAVMLTGWLMLIPVKSSPHYLKRSTDPTTPVFIQARTYSVWDRYEEQVNDFKWQKRFNWYFYSSLRVIVIILGALTPALILGMSTATQKYVTAGTAAVVAICTGLISEFDFRGETARSSAALAALQAEKVRFIALAGKTPTGSWR